MVLFWVEAFAFCNCLNNLGHLVGAGEAAVLNCLELNGKLLFNCINSAEVLCTVSSLAFKVTRVSSSSAKSSGDATFDFLKVCLWVGVMSGKSIALSKVKTGACLQLLVQAL